METEICGTNMKILWQKWKPNQSGVSSGTGAETEVSISG
jgi:hypothetical protein